MWLGAVLMLGGSCGLLAWGLLLWREETRGPRLPGKFPRGVLPHDPGGNYLESLDVEDASDWHQFADVVVNCIYSTDRP